MGIRNGEPDSAFEFSFAEWALLATENEVDSAFWKGIAPKLIKSQEIFMQVYKPNTPSPYRYEDYLPANYRPDKKVTQAFKKHLAEKYNSIDFEVAVATMGQNALLAFEGNLAAT